MSQKLDSPVQTQMAVAVLDRSFSNDYAVKNRSEGRPVGWKRIFVQTDSGLVMGLELDRGDNAHTVKRKLQIALNVPTEESSLTYGDRVLNNDLSEIRNDSPLLLTRNNMHRSSSTPCLSPRGTDVQQRDRSGPIEILGCSVHCSRMKQVVKDIERAIRNGVDPVAVNSGMGGAYYFRNIRGERVAIVKPTDEEPFAPNNPKGFVGKALGQPGLKKSVRIGETGFREVAAYLLDHDHFANVPPTLLVKITHSVFNVNEDVECSNKVYDKKNHSVSKIASLQQFISHDFDASDYGTSGFPVSAVHRIGILDIRIFNTDRHAGNLLVRKLAAESGKFGPETELIPIDHGLCLPETLEDPYFEWIHWPQASIPFSEDELQYIANLDPAKDSQMLRKELPMIREACLRVLALSTIFLKEAAKFGLCLADIGDMMSRQFTGRDEEPSELEALCITAKKLVEEMEGTLSESELTDDDPTQFELEYEEEHIIPKSPPYYNFGIARTGSSKTPLSKLDEEDVEEEENEESVEEEEDASARVSKWLPAISKLSASLKNIGVAGKKTGAYFRGISKLKESNPKSNLRGYSDLSCTSRSAKEPLPASTSFVNLSDIGEEEWASFLEKFQELLPEAFRDRKSAAAAAGQWQKQRLGTSCQF